MLKLAQMEPKPIQDVAPPPSGPEVVGDIPVRPPAEQINNEQRPQPSNDDSSFIVPATPLPPAINKDNQKPKAKDSEPKPTLVIVVIVLAVICLAAGAYLKFLANN